MAHTEAHAAEAHAHDHAPTAFIWKYVFSKDHKVIGIQYYVTAMLMALIAGLLAMLIRVQLAWPEVNWGIIGKLLPMGFQGGDGQPYVMNPEFYAMLFTMHGTIMVFFVLSTAPVSGFGNLLIPLQVGARDMAFPFLNGLSFWTFFCGCVTILTSFFVGAGAAAGGWTSYPPLSALRGAVPGSQIGQTFWIIAMVFFIASFTMGGLNFVTTIINLRTKGLSLLRMPLTLWSMFLVAILGLLAFPALTGASLMLLLDRHFGTSFFLPTGLVLNNAPMVGANGQFVHQGGSPLLWQHLFWFLGHPEVGVHPADEHVVAPDDEAQEGDGPHRAHHGPVAEDGLAAEDGDEVRREAQRGQHQDVDLGVAQEPEQVLPEQRRPALVQRRAFRRQQRLAR